MAATIKDVAKLASVSIATVSYVVNGSHQVSEETRRRVVRAVEMLEYRPSALARSLRVQRTNTVGLIVPQLGNLFFTEAAHGIEEILQRNGYSLIISESEGSPGTERRLIQMFNSLLVDGLIIVPCGRRQSELRKALRGNYPTVFLDRRLGRFAGDAVLLDNYGATVEAVGLLAGRGHRRIGMVLGSKWYSTTRDRIRAYKKALRDAGIGFDPALVRHGDYSIEAGSALAEDLLRTASPTALFLACSNMTLGAFVTVRKLGLSVPGDVAIIGCDDLAWATATEPPLSMVYQPSAAMGRKTAELLLRRIDCPTDDSEMFYLPTQLRLRGSV